jgi:hypothetical protein
MWYLNEEHTMKTTTPKAPLNVYLWGTDIGQFLAVAKDVTAARKKVMSGLSKDDYGRDELSDAIKGEPTVLGNKSIAILAFHQ